MSLIFASALAARTRATQGQLTAQNTSAKASEARLQTDLMKADVEKLFMITEALWSLLKEQHGYTDETLGQLIQDVDMRDGKLDGRVAKQQNQACPACGRTLIGKHPVCLYCGTAVIRDPFER